MSDTQPAGERQPLWTVEDDIEATIKPCPKCGGKAVLEGTYEDEIVCNECGLWSGEDMDSLEEAIEWWNKQPLLATLQQENARLAAELAEAKRKAESRWKAMDAYQQEIGDLRAELAALRAEARWEPVGDGYVTEDDELQNWWLHTSGKSIMIGGRTGGYAYFLPDNIRLCRLVPGQDTPAQEGSEK